MAQPAVRLVGTVRLSRAALLGASALQAAACLVLALPAAAQPAPSARPQGGQVVAGSASIAATTNATTITQTTNRAAVNWTSFDVGSQQSVTFAQPGPTAVTLNRVTGLDPSAIAGRISANGQVILTNPSGVTFYQGAQVNTQSIVVSAPGITNQNFMAGRMVFDQAASPNARIDNRGTITVKQAGLAALVAPSVANSGVINARLGQVVLAGAATHTLDMYGDGLVSIDVTGQVRQAPRGADGKPVTALVTNTGAILADGGVVQLTAKAADGVVQTLVRAGGRIQANTDGGQTGRIEVTGTGGSVVVEGRLVADGRAPGSVGGQVAVMADGATQVAASARISASGRAGGGTVAIGTTLARARGGARVTAAASTRTVIASGARIRADATGAGNGGQVTVLSTQDTQAGGAISARGGKQGGDGGTIELSGQQGFTLTGTADTGAPRGAPGTILIDPRDLTISTTGTNNIVPGGAAPNVGAGAGGTTTDAYVTPAQVQALTGNVVLQATRDLTVASSVTYANGALTLQAGNNLAVNTGVTLAVTTGALTLEAASAGITGFNPAGIISLQGTVTAPNLTLNAGSGGISLGGNVSTGSLVINAPTGPVVQTGGGLTVTGDMSGTALSVSLPSQTNAVAGVAALGNSFTVTGGDFTLVDHVDLAIGRVSSPGGLSVPGPGGHTITLVTDSLTVLGDGNGTSLVASNGTIAVSPFTAGLPIELVLTGTKSPAALVLTRADLSNINAINDANQSGTLQLGVRDLATAAVPSSTITLGANDQTLDLGANGFFGTLSLLTSGTVSQGAGIAIGTVTGQAGQADLSYANLGTGTSNTIGTLAGFTTTSGDFLLHTGGGLTVSGPVVANGGAGNVTLSSTDTITGRIDNVAMLLASGITGATVSLDTTNGPLLRTAGGILQTDGIVTATTLKLSGGFATLGDQNLVTNLGLTSLFSNLTLTNAQAVTISDNVTLTIGAATFTAPSITQAATSTLTAPTLSGGSGAAAFTSATNQVAAIGDFEAPNGSFALTTASPLLTIGKLNAPGGSAVIQTDSVALAAGNPSIAGSAGTVTTAFARFQPLTPGRPIELIGASAANPNALSLSQAFLNGITTTTLAIGGPGVASTINVGNAGDAVTLTTHASTLQLETGGAVTSNATATLAVADLVGATGSLAVTGAIGALGAGNAVPGTLTGYTTSTGALNLVSSVPLTVSNTVASATTVSLTGSTLTLTGPLSGSTVTLNATGAITQTGGSITAGTLTGSSGGATTLTGANLIANLGTFASNGGLTLTDGQSLIVTAPVIGPVTDPAAITLNVTGDLQLAGSLQTGALTTNVTGAITQPSGFLDVTTLSGMANSASFNGQGANVATLAGFTTKAGFALTDVGSLSVTGAVTDNASIDLSAAGLLSVSGTIQAPNVSLAANNARIEIGVLPGALTQTAGLISASNQLTLTSTGLISQTGGAIVTPTLTGNSGTTTLITGGANAIATLARFTSNGGFTVADNTGLAVTGPVTDPTSITLGVNGALQLAGTLTTAALTTNATGAITQPSGSLQLAVAGTLTGGGSSASFNQPGNVLGALNAFAATGSFGLTDSVPLAINGAVSGSGIAIVDDRPGFGAGGSLSAPGGTVQLAALTPVGLTVGGGAGIGGAPPVNAATLEIGAPGGGPVTIAGGFNLATVGTLDLESGGAIAETGAGAIRVAVLTGNGASATLGGANQIGALGGFTTTGAFALTDAQSLAVTGPVSAGFASLNVTGDLAISGALTAAQQLSLTVSGAVTEPGGVVTTGLLNGTAASLSLPTRANRIATLGPFGTTGDFTLFDGESLTVVGPVDPGNVTINVLGDLVLASSVTGNIVSLTATGAISETGGGFVNAAILTGSAGAAAFTSNNFATTLGAFTSTNGFVLDNAVTLAVTGPVTDASSIAITTRGPLTVAGAITAPSTTLVATPGRGGNLIAPGDITQTGGSIAASTLLTLNASGTISQTGGSVTAATLTGSSGGTTTLPGANSVATLGPFSSVGGFLLNSVPGLAVAGPVTDTAAITLATGGNLTLSGVLTAPVVTTNVAGAITQPGGSVQAGTLTGAAGTASFGQAGNGIATLGAFTLTGAPGAFALTDGAPLTVGGPVTTGNGGFIGITANGLLFGPGGSLTAPSGTVQLAALPPSGLTVGGGNGITGSSPVTATTLILGAATGGPVTVAGAFNLSGVTVLDLESAGAIAETGAGAISVGTLTGHGASATLTGANQIGALGLFNVGGGALTLVDTGGLTITGPVTAGALTLATGPLVIAGSVAAGTLTVSTGGGITQTAGLTSVGVLTGSASGAVSLGYAGVADIGTLGPFSAGALALLDRSALTINGPLIAPQLAVTATGQLVLAGAAIATDGLPLAQQRGGSPTLPGSFLQVLPDAAGQALLTQTGAAYVVPLSGGRATLRLDATGISLANLTAPATDLVLSLGAGGTATGNLDVGALLVLGAGGSANLSGTVAGQTLFAAAYVSQINPAFSQSYQLNYCAIASISCVATQGGFIYPQSFLRPDIISQDVIDLSPTRDRDDPTLLLPNISDRDY